jgi:transketolase
MQNPHRLSRAEIEERARNIRRTIIRMNARAGQGHTGADLSETDILATLYFRIMRYNPRDPHDAGRDWFILSKGHGAGGYYCTLAEAGFFDPGLLDSYLCFDSALPGHPVRQKTPGVEFNTGALGHGLPVSAGLALSHKLSARDNRVFVLVGDGELQEGSNWEAAMAAAKYRLDNLVVIIDRNGLQLADRTETIMPLEPLADKWRAFGFEVKEVNGNEAGELIDALESMDYSLGRPHCIIARTVKGKGVSFIEDKAAWHHKIPVGDEVELAIQELE